MAICYEIIENCYILRRSAVLSGMCTNILEEPAASDIFDMPTDDGEVCSASKPCTANPRITRLMRSEKSSRNTKTRKVNN